MTSQAITDLLKLIKHNAQRLAEADQDETEIRHYEQKLHQLTDRLSAECLKAARQNETSENT